MALAHRETLFVAIFVASYISSNFNTSVNRIGIVLYKCTHV